MNEVTPLKPVGEQWTKEDADAHMAGAVSGWKLKENAAKQLEEPKPELPSRPSLHHAYSDVGENLSKGNWGHTTKETREEHIKALSERTETTSLLAFIGQTLASIKVAVNDLREHACEIRNMQARSSGHKISHGYHFVMIRWLARSRGLLLIMDSDWDGISTRARRVLYTLRKSYVSDITEQSLLAIDGCGVATTKELLAWQDGILNPNGDSK